MENDHSEQDEALSQKSVGMTFNMPAEWHIKFKTTAVINGMSMKELLVECFNLWLHEQKRQK